MPGTSRVPLQNLKNTEQGAHPAVGEITSAGTAAANPLDTAAPFVECADPRRPQTTQISSIFPIVGLKAPVTSTYRSRQLTGHKSSLEINLFTVSADKIRAKLLDLPRPLLDMLGVVLINLAMWSYH